MSPELGCFGGWKRQRLGSLDGRSCHVPDNSQEGESIGSNKVTLSSIVCNTNNDSQITYDLRNTSSNSKKLRGQHISSNKIFALKTQYISLSIWLRKSKEGKLRLSPESVALVLMNTDSKE